MRRETDGWRIFLALGLLLAASASCGRGGPGPGSLNVLLITLDTTRSDYVSPFGAEPRITPRLQELASRSCVFTNAVAETNITNPSHLSIMSGLRAIEHGVLSNRVPMPESVDTLAEAMRRQGYRTAGFPAVRHIGPEVGWRGFDLLASVEETVPAAENTDRAAAWLRDHGGDPFFLWVHYFDPHSLYQPPAEIAARFYKGEPEAGDGPPIGRREFFDRLKAGGAALRQWLGETRDPEFPRAMYAAEIHYADREIGRLLDGLEARGLADDTLVVVVADHGESLGEHGIFYSHLGIYEQQLRIPLIVRVPGLKPSRTEALVSVLDLAPTISELTGVRLRHRCSGLSLVPLLEGEAGAAFAARTAFVHQNAHNYSVAVREGPWKLIWPVAREHALLSSRPELYHLEDDPGERVDLAAKEPGRVAALRRHLEPWIELGEVEPGTGLHLDDEALEQLRALGYLGD